MQVGIIAITFIAAILTMVLANKSIYLTHYENVFVYNLEYDGDLFSDSEALSIALQGDVRGNNCLLDMNPDIRHACITSNTTVQAEDVDALNKKARLMRSKQLKTKAGVLPALKVFRTRGALRTWFPASDSDVVCFIDSCSGAGFRKATTAVNLRALSMMGTPK